MKPVFDENGLAKGTGEIRCYHYDAATSEYIGWSDEFINIGVSMPGNSTDINPGEEVDGKVSIFSNGEWAQEPDHRGEIVYSINDGSASTIDYIGEIKVGYTVKAPGTPYDKWDGSEWLTDADAQHAAAVVEAEAKQSTLRSAADSEIEWRQDAVDAGIATEEENATLADWKKYRVLLMRVDTADPEWPTPPGQQAS